MKRKIKHRGARREAAEIVGGQELGISAARIDAVHH
jgi:hypothetical protein